MIDTEALRKKVIDLAIRGKLTEQLPSDGDAKFLYAKILEKKEKLIKEGKVRKDKDFQPVSVEEIPFEKPGNWLFVRFSSIITLQSGQDLNAADYNADGNGIPYITGASNYRDDGTLIINRWTDAPKAFANRGDILLSCKGTVGKLTILDEDEVHIARQVMGIRTYSINVRFVRFFLEWMLEVIKSASKGLIPGIERNDILNLCCPLPPLSEQNRIADKIEDVLLHIDIIDTLQQQYASDLSVLKGKIIDAGIRGKLTEQLPEDGDAETLYSQIQEEKVKLIKEGKIKKEKPLAEITEDEIPFDIPESWKWVRFVDLMTNISTGPFGSMLHKTDYVKNGIPLVNPANIVNGRIIASDKMMISSKTQERLSTYILSAGMIVIGRRGELGRCAVVTDNEEGWLCGTGSFFMKPSRNINANYICVFLGTPYARKYLSGESVGTTMSNLNHKILGQMPIPLPPLEEQYRIVDKIEKLLPYCDQLIKS